MDAYTAARLINNEMIFKPGWRMSAQVRSDSTIYLSARFAAYDSSSVDYNGNFYERTTLAPPQITIDVSGLDKAGLAHRVVRYALELEAHEMREFCQFRQRDGSWRAPLHPHTYDGGTAWQQGQARVGHRPMLPESLAA